MENLYITNYCAKECSPLDSISRLQPDEAHSLAKELSRYAGPKFTSFSRFRDQDFDGYYEKRMRTEKWLYDSFVSMGGKPKNSHPLYFVLGESSHLNEWFENGRITRLLLRTIDSGDISFTFGDSMGKMDSEDRMNPLNKQSLFDFIYGSTNDIPTFLDNLNKENRYIEVQLWNDEYVKEVMMDYQPA